MHASESVGYLVVDAGRHLLADGSVLEAGTVTTDFRRTAHEFGLAFDSQPVIMASAMTANDPAAVITRIGDVSNHGFHVQLREEELARQSNETRTHAFETVGYIALTSTATLGDLSLEMGTLDTNSVVDQDTAIPLAFTRNDQSDSSILLATMQTHNGGNTAGLRVDGLTATGANLFIRDVIDSTGAVMNHRTYNAFGELVHETNPTTETIAFGYTGRYFEENTRLQNNLNRWYDPAVGRWISEDPIGFAAEDANVYRYVGNSPSSAIDPDGLLTWSDYWVGTVAAGQQVKHDLVHGTKAIFTGEAGRALGERAVRITESQTNRPLTGSIEEYGSFGRAVAGDLVGVNPLVESYYGFDISDGRELSTLERQQRAATGISSLSGLAAGGLTSAARFAPGSFPTAARACGVGQITGLSAEQAVALERELLKIPGAKSARAFGSRTKGTATAMSDLDIALFGNIDKLSPATLAAIRQVQKFAAELGIGTGKGFRPLDITIAVSKRAFEKAFKGNPKFDPTLGVPKLKPLK